LKKNKKIDKKGSWNYKDVLKTKKKVFKEELKDKKETKILLKQLQMKIKIQVS